MFKADVRYRNGFSAAGISDHRTLRGCSLNILFNLGEHCFDNTSRLVSHSNDVLGREEEAVLAGVRQLHGVAVLDVGPSLGPVVTATAGGVEHLGS